MRQLRTEEFVPPIRNVLNLVSITLVIFWMGIVWVLFGKPPQWVEYAALGVLALGTIQLLYARSTIIKDVQKLVDSLDKLETPE